ncbi:hypothetical protein QE152_g19305 [Popillia japonica]|uniref:Uncharacterized protein n=1 Tax=Popillia japonica TaxID=7064 RepID=A0AAW1KU13_POPJA
MKGGEVDRAGDGIHVSTVRVMCWNTSCLPRVPSVYCRNCSAAKVSRVVSETGALAGHRRCGRGHYTILYHASSTRNVSKQIRGEVTVALVQRGLRDDVPLRKSAQECNFIMSIEPADLYSIYS